MLLFLCKVLVIISNFYCTYKSQSLFTGSPSAVNEFAFSPCGKYLAVVSQDGYLRVFYYNTMKLTGQARSYFGGLICVAW